MDHNDVKSFANINIFMSISNLDTKFFYNITQSLTHKYKVRHYKLNLLIQRVSLR